MNIQEMHNTFRTIGQQMGLQLIRGILPESIDVYLNSAIADFIQKELVDSVQINIQTEQLSQVSTMSKINTLKTLYRTVRYNIRLLDNSDYAKKVEYVDEKNGYYIINIPVINFDVPLEEGEYKINPMKYLHFSVEYNTTPRGYSTNCRLINADEIANTLNDYCNRVSKSTPICVLNSKPAINENNNFEEEVASQQIQIYTGRGYHTIKYLIIDYIKTPNVVRYDLDINNCINCDLPDFTHNTIVKSAIALYHSSISKTFAPINIQQ